MSSNKTQRFQTSFHWGAYQVEVKDNRIVSVHPFAGDPDPSPIGQSISDAIYHKVRIDQPMVRKGWLEHGPRYDAGGRGSEPFVPLPWNEALDMVAGELQRIKQSYGNEAIFGGSYGWGSAGQFHKPQHQLHRFLNCFGGYVRHKDTYSHAAAEVIIPHVLGDSYWTLAYDRATSWPVIAEHSGLIVMFGGIPLKNTQVDYGGIGKHNIRDWLKRCRDNGVEFVNISPVRQDAADFLEAEWLTPRPNTDTALMMGMAHTLVEEGLHDQDFLETYCTGFERFLPYLLGENDGQPKDADWAAEICAISAETIRSLARRMAASRTLITLSLSLQRADHGEQPFWMGTVLAAMLGQIGLPGGGIGYGYGAFGTTGNPVKRFKITGLPQGVNPVKIFIPVARITDMLLNPGESFHYDGQRLTYPDIRLVYWCGGNPFHHHQDLNRLVQAWQRPETIIVHEPWWNALARHADIVLPATTPLERNDIGTQGGDPIVFAMQQAIPPVAQARNDFDIFLEMAHRLGIGESYSESRDEEGWLRHIYDKISRQAKRRGIDLPDFDTFWENGHVELSIEGAQKVLLAEFRQDPETYPLATPSGRIEIFSETIESFGYDDCPGHPCWFEPVEWLGGSMARQLPLHLISHQPSTRLHSQHDLGSVSAANKIQGREPVMMNPADALARNIEDGAVVRVFNNRGACLAGVRITDDVSPGVVVLPTGAWYDPESPGGLERHGNPNVLTLDKGTSCLAQGPIAHTALVEVEAVLDELPEVGAFIPPEIREL